MAYCDKCGAYIPDNQSACLACGYDAAAAVAYAKQEEDERIAAEERRRQKQEEERRWAEAEYANRKKQQENEQKWQEAEEIRRRREQEARQRWEDMRARREAMNSAETADRVRDTVGRMGNEVRQTFDEVKTRVEDPQTGERIKEAVNKLGNEIERGSGMRKFMRILAYCGVLFLVPMILCKDDYAAQFHAKQGMRLFIFNAITTAATAAFPIAGLLKLLGLFLFIKGLSNAINDRTEPLPYIGSFKL